MDTAGLRGRVHEASEDGLEPRNEFGEAQPSRQYARFLTAAGSQVECSVECLIELTELEDEAAELSVQIVAALALGCLEPVTLHTGMPVSC